MDILQALKKSISWKESPSWEKVRLNALNFVRTMSKNKVYCKIKISFNNIKPNCL